MSEMPPIPEPDDTASDEKATVLFEHADGREPDTVELTTEQVDAIADEVNKGASY